MPDGKNETALGLGERLRSARKARALTLEQAAFTLRLEVPALQALEDERFGALGAAVFVRGHLKAYARLLGLSEEAVLEAYRATDPAADAPPKVTRELEKPLTSTPGPLAIATAVLFVVAAMLLLYILGGNQGPAPSVPDTGVVLDPAPVPDGGPVSQPITLPALAPEVQPAAEVAPEVPAADPGPGPAEVSPATPAQPPSPPAATDGGTFE